MKKIHNSKSIFRLKSKVFKSNWEFDLFLFLLSTRICCQIACCVLCRIRANMLFYQPIRNKANTIVTWPTRVFPRFVFSRAENLSCIFPPLARLAYFPALGTGCTLFLCTRATFKLSWRRYKIAATLVETTEF